jgi:vacuolar protein-sorting-associated protein 4
VLRFEKRIYIALPEADARRDMFRIHIGDTPGVHLNREEYDRLAELTEG